MTCTSSLSPETYQDAALRAREHIHAGDPFLLYRTQRLINPGPYLYYPDFQDHLMLVDLARNDIGRISTYGSVRVRDFMTIERFSHVQHIVSTVQGTLADHLTCFDAFTSCFPAGTVSGAPKIRAMEIIDDLEPQDRGLYAGAVGYIGFDRTLDFAIAIRTVVVRDGIAAMQVGAGIVADSVPDLEWKETEAKAAAMMQAIELAGGSV